MKKNDEIQIGNTSISIKDFKDLLNKYFAIHSIRKMTNLYININNKLKYLVFINLKPDKLVKINNSDLSLRIVHIKNQKELNIIFEFLNKYVLNSIITPEFNSLITIKIRVLMSYLNKIKYDLSKMDIRMNDYFSFSYLDKDNKRVVVANIERDYLFSYKFYKIVNEYLISENKMLKDDTMHKYVCKDVDELINKKNEMNLIEIDENLIDIKGYKVCKNYLIDGLDIPNLKWLKDLKSKNRTIYLIYKQISEQTFKFITLVSMPDMNIITTRPFVSFVYKKKGEK